LKKEIAKYIDMIYAYVSENSGFLFTEKNKADKNYILENRIKVNGFNSYSCYFEYLTNSGDGKKELQILINNISNNNTSFFRYKPSFVLLSEKILPELLSGKKKQNNNSKNILNIWSAGCSTGEEAYSIAISLMEAIKEIEHIKIYILATDISTSNLKKAVEGIYSADKLRLIDDKIRKKYFDEHTANVGGKKYAAKSCIKKLISFKYLNLVEKPTVFPSNMDIVFCRNVFPYLEKKEANKILHKFYDCCSENSFLFTSATDHSTPNTDLFEIIQYSDSMCFKKVVKQLDKIKNSSETFVKRRKFSDKKLLKKSIDSDIKHTDIREMPSILKPIHFEAEMLRLKAQKIHDISKGKKSYLTFLINEIPFCIDIKKVKEITHAGYLTAVPSAVQFVKGIMNLRGDILTVIDISRFLCLTEKSVKNENHMHILILNNLDSLLGIIIDSHFETFDAYENMLQPSDSSVNEKNYHSSYVKGVFYIKDKEFSLIDLDGLLKIEILEGFN
jgi:chemotaxis protein methyltransferase CheR